MDKELLKIKDLKVSVGEGKTAQVLVNDLCLDIPEESIVSLVGGSGSGKTTTGLAIMKLLPAALRIDSGQIFFAEEKKNLLKCSPQEMRRIRGKRIGMVFQEPLNAFNPVFRIGYQIEEVLIYHTDLNKRQRKEQTLQALENVGLPDPRHVARSYPHQLSGGMRQRAMIAQAIAADPELIIADEPTSSLDVTLQAKIIELFQELRTKLKISVLLITHDLGVVKHLSDEVYVMSKGCVVESGKTRNVLENPQHGYTQTLLDAVMA